MYKVIQGQLRDIEEKNNVKILYAMESGSRGWGFKSKDSDFDVRFIYVHPTEWYLNIFEGSDIIEIPVDEVLDINGWDIKKAMKLMYKSNAPLLEWLSSPIIYIENINFIKELREVSEKYFNPVSVINHYINIARKSYKGIECESSMKLKKLFYVIRPIVACMWIEKCNTIPPMNLQAMMKEVEIDNRIKEMIEELVIVKSDSIESDAINPQTELMKFLKDKIEYYDNYVKYISNQRERDSRMLNEFFHKILRDYSGGI